MEPVVIAVTPAQKPIADDAVKFGSFALAYWLADKFLFGSGASVSDAAQSVFGAVAGVAMYHLVVDKMLIKFAVSPFK